MRQTFTVGTCRYTVSVTHGADQIWAKIRKMPPSDAPHADIWNIVTEKVLLADRVAEVTELARKCKPRKPTVRADGRVYPRGGAEMSTADYVREYYIANGKQRDSVKDWVKTFYQPLSTRITPIEGEEMCLSGL